MTSILARTETGLRTFVTSFTGGCTEVRRPNLRPSQMAERDRLAQARYDARHDPDGDTGNDLLDVAKLFGASGA